MPRTRVILSILGLLVLLSAIYVLVVTFQPVQQSPRLSQEQLSQLREDYPAYNGDHPLIYMSKRPTFLDITSRSETVVIGEVISVLPEYCTNIVQPGTPEEHIEDKARSQGLPTSEPCFKQFEVKVIQHIAGEPVEDIIHLLYNAMFEGYEPDLSPGTSIITGIVRGSGVHEGKYSFTRFGTYYVTDGEHVLSTVDDEFSETMNGQTLDSLVEIILQNF